MPSPVGCAPTRSSSTTWSASRATTTSPTRAPERDIVPLRRRRHLRRRRALGWHPCVNRELFGCTWLTERAGEPCFSCSLTRTRPSDADLRGLSQFPLAEAAKRRLVVELDALGLPIVTRDDDPDHGLAFDLLSSVAENIIIGHADGVITLDLAEGDDVNRVRMRVELAEPYRTLLGHFRHEIGHYYENLLVATTTRGRAFANSSATRRSTTSQPSTATTPRDRRRAGRRTTSPATRRCTRSRTSPRRSRTSCTSATRSTPRGPIGLSTRDPSAFSRSATSCTGVWVPISTALNQINRSMGAGDLYPFVLAPA